ncbi:MAG: hypothetical protein KJ922_06235, partial [Nanoarchaeota archaeon]|nr:hypothetical protein [Nanoarchaeota archaeon]
ANTWQTVQHIIQDNFLHLLGVSKRESGCKNPVIRKTEFYLKLSPHEGSDSDEVLPAVEYIADLGHLKARISADLQSAGTKMEKPFLWTINPRIREYMMANYINDRLDLVESATLDKIRKFEPLGVVRVDLSAYLSDPASRRLICDYLQIDNDMISKVKDLHVHILMTKKVDFPESLFAEQAMLAGETIDLQEPLSLNDYVAVHSTSENYRVLTDLAEILGSTQGIMPSIISQPGWDLRSKAESQKEYLGISGLETAAFSRSLDTVVDAVESVGGQVPQTHTAKQAWVFFRNLHPLNIRICETDMFPDYIRTYDTEDRGPTPIMLETADLLEYTGAIPNDESGDAMRDHLLQVQITAYNTAADIANKDLLDRRNQPAEGIKKTYKEISRILCQSFNGDRTRAQKEVMLENLGTLVSTVCANYHGNIDGYLAELYQQASKSGFTRAKHGIAIYCLDTMQKVLSEDNLKPIIDIDSTQLRLGRENAVIYRALTFYSFLEQQKIECQTNPELYSEPVQDFAKSQQTWITNGLRAIHRLKIGHANHYAAHKADYDLMEGIFMRLRCNT